jgi:spore maturation protein CgeB
VKIIVAGDGHSELHEAPVCAAFEKLGHDVHRFFWHSYFGRQDVGGGLVGQFQQLAFRFQNKFLLGPQLDRINADLVALVERIRPEVLFIYRGTHITHRTLRRIKTILPRTILIGYNNDDPYGPGQPGWLWRHFLGSLPEYDLALAYRHHNVQDFLRAGAQQARLLRSWYVPERNHPVTLAADEQAEFGCDVAFVGHYEPDQRVEYLEEVVKQGFSLKLYGPGYDWDPVLAKSGWLKDLRPVRLVWGDDYNKALCGAKVALCFLSKLNRDTYTRRCFEIPATKTVMLAEYSDDLASLYEEGKEADYFRSKDELIAKLRLYMADETRRQSVARAGHRRVIDDRHDVMSRMTDVLNWTKDLSSHERPAFA